MAALLHVFHLSQQALPVQASLDHSIGRRTERPRLVAEWNLAADGRPACIWSADGRDAGISSG